MKTKNKVGFFCFALILTGVFFFVRENENSSAPEKITMPAEKILPAALLSETPAPQPLPKIIVSSEKVRQGDTLFVKVAGLPKIDEVAGNFNGEKIYFFRLRNFWLSIVGIGTKKEPDKYDLIVNFPDGTQSKKEISVEKTDWRVKTLRVTKELEEKGLTQSKIIDNLASQEGPMVKKAVSPVAPQAYFDKPFIYPLKKITDVGPFGDIRESPSGSLQHLGVDLDADMGTPIFAINDGNVVFAKDLPTYGKTIIIDHGLGIFSLYLHLEKFNVSEKQRTRLGDAIGYSGNTGYSIAPHLHFSIKANGASVDPLKFIETIEKGME